MTKTVLISGSGIAGASLAYWLRRHGFAPTVVERAPAPRDGGYKVDIRGAALDVVRRMGLLDRVRDLRTGVRAGAVVDRTGRRVASLHGDTFGGRAEHDCEILRGDLQRLLLDLTRGEVEHRFGDSITALSSPSQAGPSLAGPPQAGPSLAGPPQVDPSPAGPSPAGPSPAGTAVTFASGRTETYDLVIGADGLRSRTRQLAFGADGDAVRDLGYRVAICEVPNHLGLDREELTYVSPGRTTLVYSTARDTMAKAMFLFTAPEGVDESDPRRALREAYADQGWEVPRLLDAVDAAPDLYYDTMSQVHLDRWSAGPVALVGDAAHCASPASGQGTSLALVGAYLLAGELAAAGGDHTAGFRAYERRMRPFAERNQRLGPANVKRMVLAGHGRVRATMAMLSVLGRLPGRDRLAAAMMRPLHRAANAIDLPDYPTAGPVTR